MSTYAVSVDQEVVSFERGVDREAPRTRIPKGSYEAASNMLLTGPTSGRVLSTVFQDIPLDAVVAWPAGNPIWAAPYTYATYDEEESVLTYTTHLLLARDTGQIHNYVSGSPGTVENVRRGMTVDAPYVPFVYDKWLGLCNGRDAPMKYGQHFLWNGQLEPKPYMFPFGSRPISPLTGDTLGETWAHQPGSTNRFDEDARVPQGARVGPGSLRIERRKFSTLTFDDTQNYLIGPQPYGGDTFAQTDFLVCSFVAARGSRESTTGTITIRFHVNATTFSTFTFTPNVSADEWVTVPLLRSAGVASGGFVNADWDSINSIVITNNDRQLDVYVDDFFWLYNNAPPAAGVATSHKTRVILGGAPVAATPGEPVQSTLFYSDAGHPDNYPASNFQLMSGGFNSLTQAASITTLREYGDQVVVGCPNAIFAWTIGDAGNPVKATISTEHGIDSHRGLVETPQGSLLFPWQHGLYVLRATGRQYASAKIRPLVDGINLTEPEWTVAVVDEHTKTIRMAWRTTAESTVTQQGIVFDYVRAQELGEPVYPGTFTQLFDYATEVVINGDRQTVYVKHNDPQVYRMHVTRNGVGGSATLGWLSREGGDKVTKWLGLAVPYVADQAVTVETRYANIPASFDSAAFSQAQTLPASSLITEPGRVTFAGTTKYVQVRFTCAGFFELYPPITMYGTQTERRN